MSLSKRNYCNTSTRKRSRSNERSATERHKLRKHSPSATTSNNEFSFLNYKKDLNKMMTYSNDSNTIVNSLDDFWIFVKKYEDTLNKAGKTIIDVDSKDDIEITEKGIPKLFSKYHCINFKSKMKFVDTVYDERVKKKLDKKMFDVFLNIVSIYLDFKNKEKFEKLRKLRKAQNDLPVAKYRFVKEILVLCGI